MKLRPSAIAFAATAAALTLPGVAAGADPTPAPAATLAPLNPGNHLADLTWQCKLPVLGLRRAYMRWLTEMPKSVVGGASGATATMLTDISIEGIGGDTVPWGAVASWEGNAAFDVATTGPTGTTRRTRVTMALPSTKGYSDRPTSAVFSGKPLLKVETDWQGGLHVADLERVSLNLMVRDANGTPVQLPPLTTDINDAPVTDSDGDPNTFDVYCKLDPANQDHRLAATDATPGTPPATAKFGYTLQGSTTLNTLTKGSMPLTGSVDATLVVATGDVSADLKLNDTQGRLTALGFLPVTATVGFVTSGPTTGKLVDDQLTTTSKVRIKVKSVKAFGAIPLAGGNDCQSKQLSTINLKSTDSFDPTGTGGILGGTYAISDLNGCGPLEGLVSPLTAGAGNTISVKLTPVTN
ncbi:MAG: hypothetical protein J7513_08055 [Solirubrobacteraceae bacterium]|nr:hypothetical protein [Solirubrobacteraceae bacterium]